MAQSAGTGGLALREEREKYVFKRIGIVTRNSDATLRQTLDTALEVLARHDGVAIAVRQGRLLATSFHPELTGDCRVHALFVEMCRAAVPISS